MARCLSDMVLACQHIPPPVSIILRIHFHVLCSTWYSHLLITLYWDVSRLHILAVSRSLHLHLLCMVDLFLLHVWCYAL